MSQRRDATKQASERKQLIVFPRGSLDAKTKEVLSKNGYFGVEADDPKAVVTVLPMAPLACHLSGDEIVQTMAQALTSNQYASAEFGKLLVRAIAAKVRPA